MRALIDRLAAPDRQQLIRVELARTVLQNTQYVRRHNSGASRYFDILAADQPHQGKIGDLDIVYDYFNRQVRINIGLAEDARGRGYATEIYKAIPFIPVPGADTEHSDIDGFSFVSEKPSKPAERVWQHLINDGLAAYGDNGLDYVMLDDIDPPENFSIHKP